MAVLAASVCSRSGKAILSRQFKDLSHDRITALLAAFPTLLADSKAQQNTTIEEGNVRYVYQPLEDLYVVLITNKHSNILQDIDSLHLFTQTITAMLRAVDEREVLENCFQILGAFDEIINLGYKENLTILQIKTFLELDSYEEKIQDIIEKNKELEATEERKRRAKEIQRKELARRNMESGYGGNSMYEDPNKYSQQQQQQQQLQATYSPQPSISPVPSHSLLQPTKQAPRRGGLQLGKKPKATSEAQPLLVEPRAPARAPKEETYAPSPSTTPKPLANRLANNGILIGVNEKISATISRDGAVQNSEIKGDLQLRINQISLAHSSILLVLNKELDVQYKTHPNVDKQLFNHDSVLGLKDKSKGFPHNDQSLGVLRWRGVSKADDSSLLPLTFSCWVNNDGNGTVDITMEYETTERFQEFNHPISQAFVFIPAAGLNAVLKEDENNTVNLEYIENGLIFQISKLDTINSGSFEFSVECDDEEQLFPMEVSFTVENGLSNMSGVEVARISSISPETEGEEFPFDLYYNLTTDGYYIV